MSKNEIIIYDDPITKLKREGVAKVVRILISGEPLCYCKVRFAGESEVRERWVSREDVIPAT